MNLLRCHGLFRSTSLSSNVWEILSPHEINSYFKSINTDDAYIAPEPVVIPESVDIPTIDEREVWNLLVQQKRTTGGRDNLPYWFWSDYAHHLVPVVTKIFNSSLVTS